MQTLQQVLSKNIQTINLTKSMQRQRKPHIIVSHWLLMQNNLKAHLLYLHRLFIFKLLSLSFLTIDVNQDKLHWIKFYNIFKKQFAYARLHVLCKWLYDLWMLKSASLKLKSNQLILYFQTLKSTHFNIPPILGPHLLVKSLRLFA